MRVRYSILVAVVAAAALASACDQEPTCSVLTRADGTQELVCPDGTAAIVSQTASSCTIQNQGDGTAALICPDGTQLVLEGVTQLGDGELICSIVDEDDGSQTLVCDDGTSAPLPDNPDNPDKPTVEDPVNMADLSADDLARISSLRVAIETGLSVGGTSYLEQVSITLQNQGVADDYESTLDEGYSGSLAQPELCPFVKFYDNGLLPSGVGCDYLVELAKVDSYSDLADTIAGNPLPAEAVENAEEEESEFWYEQGAISGIEQHRVLVRADLEAQMLCNVTPTPYESSYSKGLIIGAQAMTDAFNAWLTASGAVADYPTMSQPINVCNINESALDPAYQAAIAAIEGTANDNPLCDGYEPPTQQHALEYAQANIEYKAGIRDGIDNEYSLAAVRIFRIVPCNVADPLVVDLDGDGLELRPVYQGVNFDFYGVGRTQAVAWVAADDGLLALDRNGNGAIDDGTELFGNVDRAHEDGFAQLRTLDANADGVITSADPAFAELVVWQDANGNAQTEAGELTAVSEVGIQAIPLNAGNVSLRCAGTRVPTLVEAVSADGSMTIGDAWFTTAPYASPSF